MVHLWFKLGQFKFCELIFSRFLSHLRKKVNEHFHEVSGDDFDGDPFELLPCNIRVLFFYYQGRFHLYNNENEKARKSL